MDKAAFIVASRYARRTVVTASSEQCDFHVPIRQGRLVELMARVIATGNTSIHVEVDMYAEDLLSGAPAGDPRTVRARRVEREEQAHGCRGLGNPKPADHGEGPWPNGQAVAGMGARAGPGTAG